MSRRATPVSRVFRETTDKTYLCITKRNELLYVLRFLLYPYLIIESAKLLYYISPIEIYRDIGKIGRARESVPRNATARHYFFLSSVYSVTKKYLYNI